MKTLNSCQRLAWTFKIGMVLLLGLVSQVNGAPNLVANGGFEDGPTAWGYTYNWAVFLGWPGAVDGRNWGEVMGTIYQDLATTPGQQYQLEFYLAGNVSISSSAVLDVLWSGDPVGTVSWNPAGHTIDNLGWVQSDFYITASTSSTRLTFQNPYVADGSGRIDFLDAISVVAVPEPSTLFLLGLGGFITLRKHRR